MIKAKALRKNSKGTLLCWLLISIVFGMFVVFAQNAYADDNEYYGSTTNTRYEIASFINEYNLKDKDVHIADQADIFTAEQEEQIVTRCKELQDELDVNFLVVIGKNISKDGAVISVEQAYSKIQGVRKCPQRGSTIIVFDMGTHDFTIQSDCPSGSDSYRYALSSDSIDYIIDEMTQDLSSKNYMSAFDIYFDLSEKYMQKGDNYNPNNILYKWWFDILIAMIISVIIVVPSVVNIGGKVTVDDRTYIKNPGSGIIGRRDMYIRTVTTKHRTSSGSGGGHGGGGGGGGGGSHGGGHGHF